jgi:hypothetical protein
MILGSVVILIGIMVGVSDTGNSSQKGEDILGSGGGLSGNSGEKTEVKA